MTSKLARRQFKTAYWHMFLLLSGLRLRDERASFTFIDDNNRDKAVYVWLFKNNLAVWQRL